MLVERAKDDRYGQRLGIRKVTAKVPRSSRGELNVDHELKTSRHTEYGTTCLSRMEQNISRSSTSLPLDIRYSGTV
jgi:hypothetical protein